MAKIVYHTKQKSVFLSRTETLLFLAAELGMELLDAFFPAKYPETRLTRRLLGLDSFSRSNFHVAKYQLIQRGLVAKRGSLHSITARGQRFVRALRAKFNDRPTAWDGQWRIVVFDIPEGKRKYREALRRELVAADYRRLQDSVWIGKHSLPDDVHEFISACDLWRCVRLFVSGSVDQPEALEAVFRKQR